MSTLYRWAIGLTTICLFTSCKQEAPSPAIDIDVVSWDSIASTAAGDDVTFMMWQGSPAVNSYINDYVKPNLKQRFNISLQTTGGQGSEIVQLLMSEQQAGVQRGQVDMVWINGETFFQLRQIAGLWGPFVQALPNSAYIDFDNPYIAIDFQQPVDYMECPWSVNQFVLVHDSAVIADPPTDLEELEMFVKAYPGTFTISNDFSGMTLLKSWMAELSGSPDGLNGPFSLSKYDKLSSQLWSYINRIKPYLWQRGETFPREQTKMDQMFASGEILIAYGFSEGSIDNKINQGLYPISAVAYPWQNGTIRNTNYLGIPYNAPHKEAAMVAINYMISPEAQLRKADPLGMDANMVLDPARLPQAWKDSVSTRPQRAHGISLMKLDDYAIQEPDPEYMIRLYEDFRIHVIEK